MNKWERKEYGYEEALELYGTFCSWHSALVTKHWTKQFPFNTFLKYLHEALLCPAVVLSYNLRNT